MTHPSARSGAALRKAGPDANEIAVIPTARIRRSTDLQKAASSSTM
jgi:hypothetical protein